MPARDGFSGPLYESTGPGFATAFNPAAVTRRQVGTMQFEILGIADGRLTYSVDGIVVTKNVTRLTMKPDNPSGTFNATLSTDSSCDGGRSLPAANSDQACASLASATRAEASDAWHCKRLMEVMGVMQHRTDGGTPFM